MPKKTSGGARCEVAMLVDIETGAWNARGKFIPEYRSVEAQVLRGLRKRHRHVVVVPFDPYSAETAAHLRWLQPELVFNLTEWINGDRSRDHAIAALLDKLNLCYTGTNAAGLRLTRDKVKTNRVVARLGIDVPKNFVLSAGVKVRNPGLAYPLFVKPAAGDGSDAISKQSLVRDDAALRSCVRRLHAKKVSRALCEEYIPGIDLFVALLGNAPQVLHPMEFVVRRHGKNAPRFSTQRVKHDVRYQKFWKLGYRKALLPQKLLREIDAASKRIFHALGLRDYARLDFRLTPDHRLVFIEANANPDLARDGFGTNGSFVGVAYDDVIKRIVAAARQRRC